MALPTPLPLSADTLRTLLRPRKIPCVSLSVPKHRPPDHEGDPVVLRHLVDRAWLTLVATRSREETERILAPWRDLEADPLFWRNGPAGFAGFAADGESWIVPLEGALEPAARVGPRFHTLPLVRRLASMERRIVVIAGSRSVRVVEATGDGEGAPRLAPVPLVRSSGPSFPDGTVPRGAIVEFVPEQPHRVMHGLGALGDAVHGGFGSRTEGVDADTRRYLRDVASMVASADVAAPGGLILVGLPRVVAAFEEGLPRHHVPCDRVAIDPSLLSEAELAHAVGDVLRVARRRRERDLADAFLEARAHGRGSGDFVEAARAAVGGRVATLLLQEGRDEPGAIDPRTGSIDFPETRTKGPSAGDDATAGDLYGALADIVLTHGGEVVIVPAEKMPTRTGVAAIYRWGENGPAPTERSRGGGRS